MCSACMTISPWASKSAVEQSRRSLMLAEWALRTSTAPISSHAARSAPVATWRAMGSRLSARSRMTVPVASVCPRQPVGHDERRLRQRDDRRPDDLIVLGLVGLPGDLGAGLHAGGADRHQLDLGAVVAVAVALLVGGGEGLAQRGGVGRDVAQRQLVGLAGVAGVPGDLVGVAGERAQRLIGQRLAAQQDRVRLVAAPLGGGEPERAEHAGGARHDDPRDPQLLGDGRGVQRSGAAEGQQREAARVDPALDGHDAQRAHHLGVGDPHDPLGAGARVGQPQLARERGDRALGGLARPAPRRRPAGAARRGGRARRWRR